MFEAQIRALRETQRAELAEMSAILETAQSRAEGERELTADEGSRFAILDAQCSARGAQIETLTAQQERENSNADAVRRLGIGGPAVVTDEPGPYSPDSSRNGGPSYFRDLWKVSKGDRDASERLTRNDRHRQASATADRAITTVNGAGGEFVPPLWLEQQFVQYARPGRAGANLTNIDRLPEGTDSINIPRLTGGTAVAAQGTQNTAIQQTDIVTDSISSGVYTVAGGQTVSLQLIEQSPLNIDRMILADLAKSYGIQIDNYVINGSGTGAPRGLLNVAGINNLVYTTTTPKLAGSATAADNLYPKLANLIALIQTSRYDVPSAWLMTPQRWYWMVSQSDNSGRPFVVPRDHGPNNAITSAGDSNVVQGVVGDLLGIPVVIDPNVPATLGPAGAGAIQDVIVLAKWDDLFLWEGQVKAQAFEQTYANQLSLFLRLYNYMSFQPGRYPKAIGTITGTGLNTPAF